MRGAWQALGRLVHAIVNWRYFKPAVFVACAIPLVDLTISFCSSSPAHPDLLTADPTKALEHLTGEDALAILLLTLSVTPVRRIFGVNKLHNIRRMLGVWSFVYAALHVTLYLVFDRTCYSPSTCQFQTIWKTCSRGSSSSWAWSRSRHCCCLR
jgi:DMSO/TMAO reductase YedYZ heme-binding membrane subunit